MSAVRRPRSSALARLAVGASLATASFGCETEGIWKVPELSLERMLVQRRLEPYRESTFFLDRSAMRRPPEGSIPRGAPVHDPALETGAVGGVPIERLPLPLTRALLERGQERFRIFCAPCHGVAGDGVSAVATKMELVRPPSLHSDRLRAQGPGKLYQTIREGYGVMPSYASEIPLGDRWAIVAYVEVLQDSQYFERARLPERLEPEATEVLR